MTSAATAKFLLFIALCLAPKDMPPTIMINSSPDTIVWTKQADGWNLNEKSLANLAWPANGVNIAGSDLLDIGKENLPDVHTIAHHNWKHDSVIVLKNGNRVEKQGNKAFYIVNPGAPNQKVYTILYMENDLAL